jgi:regulator of sigma E protease
VNALYIIPILAILILVHEIGHFVTARLVGIKVEEFGIGLPPRLFGIRRNGIIYSINLIPLGGFVRVLGEDGKSFDPGSMQAKSRLQRTLFISAGSLMNFLLAFVLMTALVGIQGEARMNVYVSEVQPDSPAQAAGWQSGDRFLTVAGKEVTSVDQVVAITEEHAGQPMPVTLLRNGQTVETEVVPRENPPPGSGRTGILITSAAAARMEVDSVDPGSPAEQAGIQPGDIVVQVGGQPIQDGSAYLLALRNAAGTTVPVVVERDGAPVELTLSVPAITPAQSEVHIGLAVRQDVVYHPLPWWQIVPRGISETWNVVVQMFHGLVQLLRGTVPFSGITGPIGMGQLTSEVLAVSSAPTWVTLTNLMVLLSLNLAILNLLPLPALDGGRLLFVAIEFIRGKRVSPEKEGVVHFVGLVLLLAFMFVVAFIDIERLVSGQSFLR